MRRSTAAWVSIALACAALWWLALAPSDVPELPAAPASPPPAPVAPARTPSPPRKPSPTPKPAPAAESDIPVPPAAQGDLAGEQKRFHADVKDPTSPQAEAAIRNTFRAPRMPAGMLQTLECRRVLCRLEMIWHPLHDPYYQVVMEQLVSAGATPLATRGGEPDERGMVRVEMIWERPN